MKLLYIGLAQFVGLEGAILNAIWRVDGRRSTKAMA